MSKTRLSKSPEQLFIDELVGDWNPDGAVAYDPTATPGDDAFIPIGKSLDDVGETYPSLTVQRTNETAPGSTGYNFIAPDGPGQDRTGQLLVTAFAEESEEGYSGDPAAYGESYGGTYDTVAASVLVEELINEVEDVCLRNAEAHETEISPLGSYRGADAPDDFDATPTVRIEQCIVLYSWSRIP